jgi:hypothetical protein
LLAGLTDFVSLSEVEDCFSLFLLEPNSNYIYKIHCGTIKLGNPEI